MIVRWLGAFGKSESLETSFNWELTQTERTELSAEILDNNISRIGHTLVGLLVNKKNVTKKFNGDCFSDKDSNKLKKGRNPKLANSSHKEAFIKPMYAGIVLKIEVLKNKKVLAICLKIAKKYKLKVLILKNGVINIYKKNQA